MRYRIVQEALERYHCGELSSETVKPQVAPFGIYQQRNGRFMARVRVSGGEIACERLNGLADILDTMGGSVHLTTRQDIQLHDLPDDRVVEAVQVCDGMDLPFKGGGGNTYRNLVVGPESGLAPDTVFDVYPYARAVNRAMLAFDKAFSLPRKFKIGFFTGAKAKLRAAVQDLGFVAGMRHGERVFGIYAGGGMGRESAVGICLAEALSAHDAVRVALASVALFHDHGDRDNRHKARLRFVLQRLGAEAFTKLFWEYYAATEVPSGGVPYEGETQLPPGFAAGRIEGEAVLPEALKKGFELWRQFAVVPTRFGGEVWSVRLFVPYGNLTAVQLRKIAALAEEMGSPFVRLLVTQDILIPFVAESALPCLYQRLRNTLAEIDLTFDSYRGHLVTCVGASVCRIGIVDSPRVADSIAPLLDPYLPPDTPEKLKLLKRLSDEVRISGCLNACSAHPAAQIGIECLKRRVGEEVQVFGAFYAGAGDGDGEGAPGLSARLPGDALPLGQLAQKVLELGLQDAAVRAGL